MFLSSPGLLVRLLASRALLAQCNESLTWGAQFRDTFDGVWFIRVANMARDVTGQRCLERIRRVAALGLTVLAIHLPVPNAARCGGLQAVPAQARGGALGLATVALSSDPAEFPRNPALLGGHSGTRLTLGAGLIVPEYRFAGIAPSQAETKSEPVFLFPPSFALSFAIEEWLGVGLSAGAPFLARSEWASGWVGRQLTTSFEHRTGVLAPAVAFTPLEGISLGAGLPLRLTRHVMTSQVYEPGIGSTPGATYQKTVEGESDVDVGIQLGVLLTGDSWSFGGSYTSGGEIAISDAEASLSTRDPQASRETYLGRRARVSMNLPAELAVGATFSPTRSLLVTTEFDLVMWSVAEEISYDIPNTPDGYAVPQHWDDSYRMALGAEYNLGAIDLRAGFSFDASPIPDATCHPAYPDANRYGYSMGLGYRVGPGLLLDFGVSAFAFEDRTVGDSEMVVTNESTGVPDQAFNGMYRTALTSISISVSYLWR